MLRLVYPILILNIFFPLGKMIGMVQLRTNFVLSSRSWEIGSPPTGGAEKDEIVLCHTRIGHRS